MPPPERLVTLEPEEVGMFVLKDLCEKSKPESRYNYTLKSNVRNYANDIDVDEVSRVLMEGWVWLEREGLIAPAPNQTGDWFFVTRRGYSLNESGDLDKYKNAGLLPEAKLDPILARKVRPLFIRGDYDAAIFQAYKEVEVRTREAAGLGNEMIGRELMKEAFHAENGILRDSGQEASEREAVFFLFMGSIGLLKNPHSHRNIELNDPVEASELIGFANYLLNIVEDRKEQFRSQ